MPDAVNQTLFPKNGARAAKKSDRETNIAKNRRNCTVFFFFLFVKMRNHAKFYSICTDTIHNYATQKTGTGRPGKTGGSRIHCLQPHISCTWEPYENTRKISGRTALFARTAHIFPSFLLHDGGDPVLLRQKGCGPKTGLPFHTRGSQRFEVYGRHRFRDQLGFRSEKGVSPGPVP